MEDRTLEYLRGRFRDYYRYTNPYLPPSAERREWGFIPWTIGKGTIMKRHQSLLSTGNLHQFLIENRPKHVYFSAGTYQSPGTPSMMGKKWIGSDLIFDLDADHLPSISPEKDTYADMLLACKEELWKLLDFIIEDFNFSNPEIVFSGGRGYHVHVRDEGVRELDRSARREIVNYLIGSGIGIETLVNKEVVGGIGLKNPTHKKSIGTMGGWSEKVHREILNYIEDLSKLDDESAVKQLQSFDGIGSKTAKNILVVIRKKYEEISIGNIDVHPDFFKLVGKLVPSVVEKKSALIDEPVTTDLHRLIRLPLSLHGGTSLQVKPIEYNDLDKFDPLVDAVPNRFKKYEINVKVKEDISIEIGGETFTASEGIVTLPEYAAMFMMARGKAEKIKE